MITNPPLKKRKPMRQTLIGGDSAVLFGAMASGRALAIAFKRWNCATAQGF